MLTIQNLVESSKGALQQLTHALAGYPFCIDQIDILSGIIRVVNPEMATLLFSITTNERLASGSLEKAAVYVHHLVTELTSGKLCHWQSPISRSTHRVVKRVNTR